MATRSFIADHRDDGFTADRVGTGPLNHHRLTVLAASMPEVVGMAGGWLFDRARAGWTVSVVVDGGGDVRPLTIVGATHIDADCATVLRELARDAAVAVSAELLRTQAGVRDQVLERVASGVADVTMWGRWPAELGARIEPTQYRLSVAARAFKARAAAAARLEPGDADATEALFELRTDALRPLYPV